MLVVGAARRIRPDAGRGTAPTAALGPPRFVDETAPRASPTPTAAGHLRDRRRRRGPRLRRRREARPVPRRRRESRRPSTATTAGSGRAALLAGPRPGHRPRRRHRRLPDRHRRRWQRRPRRPARRRERHAPRPRRLPLRAGERGVGVRRRPTAGTAAFSATWEGATALPTLAFGDYLTLDATGDADVRLRPERSPAAGRVGSPLRPEPIPLTPGYCTLSMLFSDWDGSGRRDLRVTNDRHYYADGQDQLWRVATGEAPRLYTAEDGWVALQIIGHGDRRARRHRRRVPRLLPHEPGRQQAADADARAGPAHLPRHRPQARRHRDAAGHRRRRPAVDRLAPGVPGRQQRRLHRPARHQGQRPRRPTTRRRTRATCSSGSRTAPS